MQKQKVGLREIFDIYGEQYISSNHVTPQEKGLIRLLASCKTGSLGSHTNSCNLCGHTETAYNSCRNRHCPECQLKDQLKWTKKRLDELLPVGYYHLVFTLPHQLNLFCLQNKKPMYDILFKAASQTIKELAEDPKHAGAKTGLTCVLHTWGQNLMDHIHLHMLMPAGGFTNDGNDWLHFDKKDGFFVYYKVVSRLFRKKFLLLFKQVYDKGEISCKAGLSKYQSKNMFDIFTRDLEKMDWVVNIQPPMGNPEKIVEYLSRYVYRTAISNSRIKRVENGVVYFTWKDYRTKMFRPMKLDVDEFIRRFLIHCLPKRFLKVRYYGFFCNRYRTPNLERAGKILQHQQEIKAEEAFEDGRLIWIKQDTVWDEIKKMIGSFVFPNCPVCKKGRMLFSGIAATPVNYAPG